MSWRVARSLEVLRAEINAAAPNRSIVSDGSIGDAAHASRSSDHNPWVKDSAGVGVVRARDFTNDPRGGLDCGALALHLATLLGMHPALGSGAYIIWDRRIVSTDRLREGWRPYTGSNPHTKHLHLSVGLTGYDSGAGYGWPPQAPKPSTQALRKSIRAAEREAKRAQRPGLADRLKAVRLRLREAARR